jgi:hypothetical protein
MVRKFKGVNKGKLKINRCFGGIKKELIESGSEDKKVYVWKIKSEIKIDNINGKKSKVKCV